MALDFTIPVEFLRPLVEQVGRIIAKRNTVPILSNCVIRAGEDGAVEIEGTDLDVWALARTSSNTAEVRADGATTVPAGLLADFLKRCTGEIRVRQDEARVVLTCGRATLRLNCLPEVDFPTRPKAPDLPPIRLSGALLTKIADAVSFAISSEETRYYLNGIHFQMRETDAGRRLVTVATDGHRLSKLASEIDGAPEFPAAIVPRKMCGLLGLVAANLDADDTAVVTISESTISFALPKMIVQSRLIDGTFPDYDRVIPRDNGASVTLDRAAFIGAVERVGAISDERHRAVKLSPAEGELKLSVLSPDHGEAHDTLAAETDGFADWFEIGFSAKYLVDALKSFTAPHLALRLAAPGAPALLIDPADDTRTVVLMPMRV